MKKIFSVLLLMYGFCFGDGLFQSVEKEQATLLQSSSAKEYCPTCGMNLVKFYKTSHAVKFKDGTYRQFCSLHCLVDESEMGFLRDKKNKIAQTLVVDTNSLKMIDTKEAFYVVGSNKAGTMSAVSQYAFGSQKEAQSFQKANGGKIMSFDEAYTGSLKAFSDTIKMIKDKKEGSVYNAGKTILAKFCDEAKVLAVHAHDIGQTKQLIKETKACRDDLNDGQLQALALYYWDVKLGNFEKNYGKLVK